MSNFGLSLILHIFIGSTLAGIGVIVALTLGYTQLNGILISAALGFIVAIPASWIIAQRVSAAGR